jgi:hypothetical protein
MSRTAFEALRDRYLRETCHFSFEKPDHPDHQAIVAMGDDAVRFILEDFAGGMAYHLFGILGRAAAKNHGDRPYVVPEADRGRVYKMAGHFVRWGRERGLLPPMECDQCGEEMTTVRRRVLGWEHRPPGEEGEGGRFCDRCHYTLAGWRFE